MGTNYDEKEQIKHRNEVLSDPSQKLLDDESDIIFFEIAIINKQNKAVVMDCRVKNGELLINQLFNIKDNANEFVSSVWVDKMWKKKANKFYD